jgi:peptide deformylase
MSTDPLTLLLYPHPRLRDKADAPLPDWEQLRQISRQMFDVMYQNRGRGLAATQVGLRYRLFVTNPTGDANEVGREQVFVNPRIVDVKPRRARDEEGCLSLPGLYADVDRPRRVKVAYEDLDGVTIVATYDGTFARIFQHELDHLDGVLFIDHLDAKERTKIQAGIDEMERRWQDSPQQAAPT